MTWEAEAIPDPDHVYRRAHRVHLDADGTFKPSIFKDIGGSVSTNWEKYCATAEECRAKAKEPPKNGVLKGNAGSVRGIPDLAVTHTPVQETEPVPDRSHTCVLGPKPEAVRLKLHEIFEIVLLPIT